MTETEHAQWTRQFWKDKLDEIKTDSNEAVRIAYNQGRQDALEEVRAEISTILTNSYDEGVKEKALQILDKYKGEQ